MEAITAEAREALAAMKSPDAAARSAAIRQLAQLLCKIDSNEALLEDLFDAECHTRLVEELADVTGDGARWACLSIFYFARSSTNRRVMSDAGAVHALVTTLQAAVDGGNDVLIEPAVMAVVNLSVATGGDCANCNHITASGGVDTLLKVLRAGRGKELCSSAALALSNVAASSPANCVAVRDSGGVVPIVALLVVACKICDAELMRNAGGLVNALSADQSSREAMRAAGAADALRRAAAKGGKAPEECAGDEFLSTVHATLAVLSGVTAHQKQNLAPNKENASPGPAFSGPCGAAEPSSSPQPLSPAPSKAPLAGRTMSGSKFFGRMTSFFRSSPAKKPAPLQAVGNPLHAPPQQRSAEDAELEQALSLSLEEAEKAREQAAEEDQAFEEALRASLEEAAGAGGGCAPRTPEHSFEHMDPAALIFGFAGGPASPPRAVAV